MKFRFFPLIIILLMVFGCENSLFKELTDFESYEKQKSDYSSNSTSSESSIANEIRNMTSSGTVYVTREVDSNIFSVLNGALFSLKQNNPDVMVTLDFSGAVGLTKIDDYAFYDAENLSGIIFPDTLRSIEELAFYSCSALTSITIPDSVTDIESRAFQDCTNLASVKIGNGLTSVKDVFWGCSNLVNVTIGNNVTTIEKQAFYACSSLTDITIPASVTKIGEYAFGGCEKLTNVVFVDTESIWYEKYSSENSFTEIGPMSASDIKTNAITLKNAISGGSFMYNEKYNSSATSNSTTTTDSSSITETITYTTNSELPGIYYINWTNSGNSLTSNPYLYLDGSWYGYPNNGSIQLSSGTHTFYLTTSSGTRISNILTIVVTDSPYWYNHDN